MAFLSVVIALVLEQFYALHKLNPISLWSRWAAEKIAKNFDAGESNNGRTAWCVLVLPLTLLIALVHYFLSDAYAIFSLAWSIAVLYMTFGFRRFSHYFTSIHRALRQRDRILAENILRQWRAPEAVQQEITEAEIVRLALEKGVRAVHVHVFGVFFWFVAFGPAGAIFYRLSEYAAERWGILKYHLHSPLFGLFAQRIFYYINWLPLRLTALGFAIVGDFEEAIYAWRHHAKDHVAADERVLLAAAGGALGVDLVAVVSRAPDEAMDVQHDSALPIPVETNQGISVATLESAIGLVWRAVILWLLLLALLLVATWLG